jgi:PD-(D/E)XK nuclease superfamily protein
MADAAALPESGEDSPSGASLRGPHRLAAIETCQRMWALRYYWYFRPAYENAWRLGGSLLHTCYQYLYASMMTPPPAWFFEKSLAERIYEQALDIHEPARTELVQMAWNNFAAYRQIYAADGSYFRPIAIEEEFAATLGEIDPGGPWPELDNELVTCRSDLVYETLQDCDVWGLDYKSHGRSRVNPRTGRLTRWKDDGEHAIDWQVLLNLLILRARLGPRVRGFVIQRTTRQPPYDFDRHVLTIPAVAYEEAGRTARELVKREIEVMQKIENGGKPSPRYYACQGRFGACDYRPVCMASSKEAMNNILAADYRRPPPAEVAAMHARLRVVR